MREEEEKEEEERKKYARIPYIPEIAHPLKRVLKKAGVTTIFASGPKLQNILCGVNKTRPDPQKRRESTGISARVRINRSMSDKRPERATNAGRNMATPSGAKIGIIPV